MDWLKENCEDDWRVFYLYGKNAFEKTRTKEGNEAFGIVKSLVPAMKMKLAFLKNGLIIKAGLRSLLKKIYLNLRV